MKLVLMQAIDGENIVTLYEDRREKRFSVVYNERIILDTADQKKAEEVYWDELRKEIF